MNHEPYLDPYSLRKDNLNQFISDRYNGDEKRFYLELNDLMITKLNRTYDQADSKIKQLRSAMAGYENKPFSDTLQKIVEECYDLPKNILTQVRPRRSPAYIFLSCTGESVSPIFSKIKSHEIVDEISVLFGDIDVFIKVFATKKQVQKFITEDIFNIEGVTINRTKTYFSLEDKVWLRYSPGEHPAYSPPSQRWVNLSDSDSA